ncbi:MAG TPA: glucose-1-phosphate adenylyltransferase family protein [Gaiellales bacterium]|jgi:glucose-1-phosphate adenylyltransferase
MARLKVLATVMAGGAGGRMRPLTDARAKPSLPFGGVYRLIDIPLSNCANSGISDVWVFEQYQPHGLTDHLSNGRPWDLDRTRGGLLVVQPHTGSTGEGWHHGNADALYREREIIREFDPDVLLVLSADHVYRLDLLDVANEHAASGAAVTVVTADVPRGEAARFGTVHVDDEGAVTAFAYKPDEPDTGVVTSEIFAYRPASLLETLERSAAERRDGESLGDFGDDLLPRLVAAGGARARPLGGYWRDLGTLPSYWQAHMDLLGNRPRFQLAEPDWPFFTAASTRVPARVGGSARLDEALLSPGCAVHGEVIRSVIGPGAVVEEGSRVVESVLFDDVQVVAGATVERAIVDTGERVDAGVRGQGGDIAVVRRA